MSSDYEASSFHTRAHMQNSRWDGREGDLASRDRDPYGHGSISRATDLRTSYNGTVVDTTAQLRKTNTLKKSGKFIEPSDAHLHLTLLSHNEGGVLPSLKQSTVNRSDSEDADAAYAKEGDESELLIKTTDKNTSRQTYLPVPTKTLDKARPSGGKDAYDRKKSAHHLRATAVPTSRRRVKRSASFEENSRGTLI